MFQRAEIKILHKRIEQENRKYMQVIAGPRQVGKTTLVNQFLQDTSLSYHFASADGVAAASMSWISQQWETARFQWQQDKEKDFILVIDEIQKIDNWSEGVKKEWDADTRENRKIKCILLGSSRVLLQQGLTESLVGRYEMITMSHWSYAEMHQAFDYSVEEYIWYGGYPGAATFIDDEDRWNRYIQDSIIESSISKDILMLTRVDKPALMRRLFELGCGYSGQILAFNKILGQLHDAGNTTTLSHYLDLLEGAGLLGGLEKYSGSKIRQRSSSPKFQVYNNAFLSVQSSEPFADIHSKPGQWGRWVESIVGTHLINEAMKGNIKLYYWRHRNKEVDFVIELNQKIIGLEVKSGRNQRSGGMEAFAAQYNPDKMLLVGQEGIPLKEFLSVSPKELFT